MTNTNGTGSKLEAREQLFSAVPGAAGVFGLYLLGISFEISRRLSAASLATPSLITCRLIGFVCLFLSSPPTSGHTLLSSFPKLVRQASSLLFFYAFLHSRIVFLSVFFGTLLRLRVETQIQAGR